MCFLIANGDEKGHWYCFSCFEVFSHSIVGRAILQSCVYLVVQAK